MSGRTAALVARTALDGEEVSHKVLSHVSWRCSTICGQLGVKEPLRGKVQKGNFPAEDLYPQLEPLIEESGLDSSGMMNL